MNVPGETRVSVYRVWLRLLSGEINLFPLPSPQSSSKLGQPRETDRILPSDTLEQKFLDSRARVRKAIPSDLSFNDRQTIRRVS